MVLVPLPLQVARRSEQVPGAEQVMFVGGCQAERDQETILNGPLLVEIDGSSMRAQHDRNKATNLFEMIVGKSILSLCRNDPQDVPPSSTCFALVQSVDKQPKRRLFDLLRSQGMQASQQLTFFSDGGEAGKTMITLVHKLLLRNSQSAYK